MFHPSEVELAATTKLILADVERLKPTRVVFDSLSELRLLAGSALRYRRQILALKQFFAGRDCTVLLLDDMTATDHDLQVQSIAHGVDPAASSSVPSTARSGAGCASSSTAACQFRGGYHDYIIETGGLTSSRAWSPPSTGKADRAGKLAKRHCRARRAAGRRARGRHQHADRRRGRHRQVDARASSSSPRPSAGRTSAHVRLRRESADAAHRGATAWASSSRRARRRRRGQLQQVDPAELTPGEFTARDSATRSRSSGAKIVVIDSLNGYLNAMPEERFLTIQLHELLMYLGQRGVADDPDRRAPGPDRHADDTRRSTRATWPTPSSCCATSSRRARCGRRSRW